MLAKVGSRSLAARCAFERLCGAGRGPVVTSSLGCGCRGTLRPRPRWGRRRPNTWVGFGEVRVGFGQVPACFDHYLVDLEIKLVGFGQTWLGDNISIGFAMSSTNYGPTPAQFPGFRPNLRLVRPIWVGCDQCGLAEATLVLASNNFQLASTSIGMFRPLVGRRSPNSGWPGSATSHTGQST